MKELEILKILMENAKAEPDKIGVMLGMDPEEVKQIIKKLEDDKVIVKYMTLIDWEKTSCDKVQALIDVRVLPERGVGFDRVAQRIAMFPEVRSVYLMSGGYDLSVRVEGKSLKEVANFVSEKLAPLEHVQSTTTHFILKMYKKDGVILGDKEEDKRQVMIP
ncbi:MAG TPA: Lrp/AsnC family transcriptional regulator [Clostridia bacterium]|jgi:DNA-binding Lrp family transcriptional regulator|nr:Lrp/AsnC family transcriptional regulator [Clostridia bacterium]